MNATSATLFLTSFAFIFLAAAPGRTTFVLILLASRGHLKKVFAGAIAAFLIQSLFAVLLGEVLALFPKFAIELLAGLLFVYFGWSFWKQSGQPLTPMQEANTASDARSAFILVFLAEFGDVSQLAIATVASRSSSKLTVFVAAVSALSVLTGLALFLGHALKRMIKPELIQRAASVVFLGFGVFLIVHGIFSRFALL